jgi:hypothetical protein
VAFVLVATANGAGYRYGVSDQAFYIPVVVRALDPTAYPRDSAVIDAQGRLMLSDEVLATVVRTTGWPLDAVFLGAYLLTAGVLYAGLMLIGSRVYRYTWTSWALVAALTLRHRITRTSANSIEPYYHPRTLAFGVGLLAVAALLRSRSGLAVALVGTAGAIHVTTGLWFMVLVGTALVVQDRWWRTVAAPVALTGGLAAVWLLRSSILQGRFTTMDDVWLQAVATKDSLFASQWPLSAWAANLGLVAALWVAHVVRRRAGRATPQDAGLAWGATALSALFLVTLPIVSAGVAFFVQLQIPRVFWLIDIVATIYVIGALAEGVPGATARRAAMVAAVLAVAAAGRGLYVMLLERPGRPLFAMHLENDAWQDAMGWLRRQDRRVHVFADPGHSWKFGTSVRVSAERDVLLEEVKDSALAIYSRDVAARVMDRTMAVDDFMALTPEKARSLAMRYDLDYLVTATEMPLPEAYRNSRFHVYALRDEGSAQR